jgi:hypothetical protein
MSGFAAHAQQSAPDSQKVAQEYMKLMMPGEHHAFLKNYAGDWQIETTAMMTPGAAPVKSQSTAHAELIMGDRFVMTRFTGTMFGQPFEGFQIIGYDNIGKKYRSFWIDNMGTSFYMTSGNLDKTGKVLRETGQWPNPMGKAPMPVRAITRFTGPGEFTYELYMTGQDGKEMKALENKAVMKK